MCGKNNGKKTREKNPKNGKEYKLMFNTPSVTKEQYDDLKATKTHVIDTLNWKLRLV